MKYYSDLTKKVYESVEDLEKAEVEIKAEQERVAALKEKRAERAKEVEDAFEKAYKLRNEFIKDYGSFHQTIKSINSPIESLFDVFFG